MSDIFEDGHVIQDGLPRTPRQPGGKQLTRVPYPVKGYVLASYYIDDPENRNGETMVCDVHIPKMGIDIFKVPVMFKKASIDNYEQFWPQVHTENIDKSKFNPRAINPKVTNGDVVIIVFIDESIYDPIIIGSYPHKQTGLGGKSPSIVGKRADGDFYKNRMNGTEFIIDKDGNVTFKTTKTFNEKIPAKKTFSFQLNEDGKSQKIDLTLDNTGDGKATLKVNSEGNKAQTIELDKEKITVTNQNASGENSVLLDANGITINVATKVTVNSTGDTVLNSGGKVDIIGTADVTISSSGKMTVKGTGGTDVGSSSSETNVNGASVVLAGGAMPVARVGDKAIGVGNLGAPVISNIIAGSPKVKA